MEIALINNDSLILGPMGFNVRMINSELEDFELEDRISPQSIKDLPIHFSDGVTHLLPLERIVPGHDPNYHNIGNFEWEIVKENDIPVKVVITYSIFEKTLEEVKQLRKQEVSPTRKGKENTIITLSVNGTEIQVSTSREERVILASKIASTPGPHNYKFLNTWLEVTTDQLQTILSAIDAVVQAAFDWELAKLQEIDACTTIEEVYEVVIAERPPTDRPQASQPQFQ